LRGAAGLDRSGPRLSLLKSATEKAAGVFPLACRSVTASHCGSLPEDGWGHDGAVACLPVWAAASIAGRIEVIVVSHLAILALAIGFTF
jgi:hypothetical protein